MTQTTPGTARTIQIEGMMGDVCVRKVTDALTAVPDVVTRSVRVGSAEIVADDKGCTAACAAINGAGFKAQSPSESIKAAGERLDDDGAPVIHTPAPKPPVASGYPETQPVNPDRSKVQ